MELKPTTFKEGMQRIGELTEQIRLILNSEIISKRKIGSKRKEATEQEISKIIKNLCQIKKKLKKKSKKDKKRETIE